MQTLEFIKDSALPTETKGEILRLVEQFISAQAEHKCSMADMHGAKVGLNERQYATRLSEEMTDTQRNFRIFHQYACRHSFSSAVYRAMEARRSLQLLGKAIAEKMATIEIVDGTVKNALVALKALLNGETANADGNPEHVLFEMMKVSDIDPGKLDDAGRQIFLQKKSGKGPFADKPFRCSLIVFASPPSPEQVALGQAIESAMAAHKSFSLVSDDLHDARCRMNLPQFIERLEKAAVAGDKVAFARILQALKVAEAQVYLAATALLKALPGYKQEAANLAASVNLAANAIERDEELEDLMYMSNCIAGWLWLHKFQDMLKRHTDVPHSPAVAIKMLRFDADAYIQG